MFKHQCGMGARRHNREKRPSPISLTITVKKSGEMVIAKFDPLETIVKRLLTKGKPLPIVKADNTGSGE